MRPSVVTKSLVAAVATGIAASQSLASAGALTLNGSLVTGGVAVFDTQRQVIITSAGNDSALTWTVTGTDDNGAPIKDQFVGGNIAAATSNLNFKTVTSITGSAASASTVTAGTNGVGSSPWKLFDDNVTPPAISFDCELTGSANYQVEYTQDEVLMPIGATATIANGPVTPNPIALPFSDLTNKSATAQGNETIVFRAWRLKILSGTGSVKCTGRQAGLAAP